MYRGSLLRPSGYAGQAGFGVQRFRVQGSEVRGSEVRGQRAEVRGQMYRGSLLRPSGCAGQAGYGVQPSHDAKAVRLVLISAIRVLLNNIRLLFLSQSPQITELFRLFSAYSERD